MTQSIVIHVGQCGNQIGYRFWEAALREYTSFGETQLDSNNSLSFFNKTTGKKTTMKSKKGNNLKARAVLIDMEEGVINEILNSRLRDLFDHNQLITDVSGAGNNWAVGHFEYGRQYKESISDVIRRTAEECDCLQCFFCLHSMGGGTGAGVGTFVLRLLEDEYPDVFRFSTVVYPSETDDVITSPYNSILAMHNLTEAADCVLSIENQSLLRMVQKMKKQGDTKSAQNDPDKSTKAFDDMNDIVANLLVNLTCSARFEGSLNVDLNEISMNLVPFPKLHYITSSMAPLYSSSKKSNFSLRHLNQMFTDSFSKDNQLMQVDPMHGLYLACSLLVRGNVEISDIRQNIEKLKPNLNFIHWNQEGWKVGLCSVPPLNHTSALLTLANNTCFHHPCLDIRNRFMKLYKRKAHLHHYTRVEGFEEDLIKRSLISLDSLIDEYEELEKSIHNPVPSLERLIVA